MLRRLAALAVAGAMLAGDALPAAPPTHPALARGLALMREGDFEAAVLELDAAARKMEADPGARRDRPWAYVYLGVAYLELEQEGVARGKFREALARDAALRLLPSDFSAQSIRVFEAVRAEAAAVAAPAPASAPVVPRATPAPPTAEGGRKGSKGPLVAVLLGGAAAAGAAVALGGGGDSGGTTTTPGQPTSTTTATQPPATEPPATQPPATQPPATTPPTTPPATQPPTTQPPGTTPPPACTYSMGGANPPAFPFQGGNGTCQVTASRPDCSWTAVTNANWIDIQNGGGSGSGTVGFTVQPNPTLAARSGTIRLLEGSQPSCSITQAAAVLAGTVDEPVLGWTSDLQVPGGRGQVVVDGTHATFHESGARQGWAESRASRHRIEGTLVTADGRAGTWRFRLEGPLAPGSLRVIAGEVAAIAADTITFRLAGRPGERVVFTFVGR